MLSSPRWASARNSSSARARLDAIFSGAKARDTVKAAAKLTSIVDGRLVIKEDPPVVRRVEIPGGGRRWPLYLMRTAPRCRKACASSSSAIGSPTTR